MQPNILTMKTVSVVAAATPERIWKIYSKLAWNEYVRFLLCVDEFAVVHNSCECDFDAFVFDGRWDHDIKEMKSADCSTVGKRLVP